MWWGDRSIDKSMEVKVDSVHPRYISLLATVQAAG